MADASGNVPYDQLPPSFTSSSDEGIREDNTKGSNVNLFSSSTLNDKGMSLHSFTEGSEIFAEKGQLSIQTVLNDSYVRSRSKGTMGVSSSVQDIPGFKTQLVVSTFQFEFKPFQPTLSTFSVVTPPILSRKETCESRETNTNPRNAGFREQNVSNLTILYVPSMSMETFHQEILPTNFHAKSSKSLKTLEKQMLSLQSVFKNVKVTRELNVFTLNQNGSGCVEIKQFIENIGTQTLETTSQNTDFSVNRIEALILECEFFRAATTMIRKYPFYYDFLKRCYSERNFDGTGKLRYLKPKQKSFKRAVVHAHGCNRSHLEAVNAILLDFFNGGRCLCNE